MWLQKQLRIFVDCDLEDLDKVKQIMLYRVSYIFSKIKFKVIKGAFQFFVNLGVIVMYFAV